MNTPIYFENDKELRKYEIKEDLYKFRYLIIPLAVFGAGVIFMTIILI